jgi:ubiquinone/menaquinone biosynthesis C-methylase UbiE
MAFDRRILDSGKLALAAVILIVGPVALASAQTTTPPSNANPARQQDSGGTGAVKERPKSKISAKSRVPRDRPGFYMGRRIADVMSWEGVDWLFRETRINEEEPESMLDALAISPGATVADVGAGAGYHSVRLARRVGPKGTVLASDVQPEMLRMLENNARSAGVTNIKPVRATQADPRLPENAVDLILMVDVYHECSRPDVTLRGLRKALKPHGRLVLVEFRGEDDDVPIKPEHKMTLAQVRREVEPEGYVFKESLEFLPWQHVIIFEKPADAKQPGDAEAPNASANSSGSR